MKISTQVSKAQVSQGQTPSVKGSRSGGTQGLESSNILKGEASGSSQVHLSDRAQQIQKVSQWVQKNPVDHKRVSYFQNLIDSGKYKVDAEGVAESLLDEHMRMPY